MRRLLAVLSIVAAVATPALASNEDDLTSLSYISYMERYATVQSASQTDSTEAVINMPLIPGDRLDTAREARVEVQLPDGSTLWLDQYTSVSFDAVAFSRGDSSDRTVLFFGDGSVVLNIPTTALTSKPTRVDTTSSTVYLSRPGIYRLEVLRDGSLRVEVWDGHAEVATPEGGSVVESGSSVEVAGGTVERTEAVLTQDDAFAQWVHGRLQPGGGSADLHMEARYSRQEAVLNSYGGWIYVDDLGSYAWRPSVSVGWTPYTYGRWGWTPTGWCWISYEPWGWMPYHYGSWYFSAGFGWVWSWGSYWGPAWVDWAWWPGYVGWCPRGYYDYWYWNRYPGHRPGHPGYPGHPAPYPGARDRVPGPSHGVIGPGSRPPIRPDRFALGFEGSARLRDVDPRGWNVVRADNFTDPHLPRLVTPGRDVFPRLAPDVRGVVRSGPLVTERPTARRVGDEVQRPFLEAAPRAKADLTPILARDTSLPPDRAGALVRATTPAALAGSARERSGLSAAVSSGGRMTPTDRLASPAPSSESAPGRHPGTFRGSSNLYRPTLRRTADGTVAPSPRGRSSLERPSTAGARGVGVPPRSRASVPQPSNEPRAQTPGERLRPDPAARRPIRLRGGSLRSPSSPGPSVAPRTGGSAPSYGGFIQPAPRSGSTSTPWHSGSSSYGGFVRPSTPSRPAPRSSVRPSARSSGRPSSRSYSRPSSRSYSRPSSRSYSRPSSRSYSRPSSRSYSRPSRSSSHRSSGRRR